MSLPTLIADLPVGHLQLSGRAATASAGHATIGELVAGFGSHERESARTASVDSQVKRVISMLSGSVRKNGALGWDHFRKARPLFATAATIYFFSPALDRLSSAVAGGRLGRLHLSRRAITALHAVGVTKIGDLIRHSRNGIVELRACGELTTTDICESLDALADSVGADGAVDWISYAQRRGFQLLPATARPEYSGRDFLWEFPKACEEAVRIKFGAPGTVLLRNRVFRHRDILVPLSDIATKLGHTPERSRLLEASIIKMLRRTIWREEYRGCRFRFRPEFLRPLYDLRDSVEDIPAGALSINRWRSVLDHCWGVPPEDLGQLETIILQLLDLESYFAAEASVILPDNDQSRVFRNILTAIKRLFASSGAVSLTGEHIRQQLLQGFGEFAPDRTSLTAILDELPTVERDPTSGAYHTRLEYLKNHVDQCERILREHSVPMHYREVAAEIDRRLPSTCERLPAKRLASAMAGSKRFAAIGKTGRWALREWTHVETRTIGDLAVESLTQARAPMSEQELFDTIAPLRSVSRRSLGSYLHGDGRFRRVAPTVWTLADGATSAMPTSAAASTALSSNMDVAAAARDEPKSTRNHESRESSFPENV